ncbi:MAG: sensor histidine kinase [Solirubrobacterales bacterium]|nr:sensor histidine kinase [Solirubrobacterales bacterium]
MPVAPDRSPGDVQRLQRLLAVGRSLTAELDLDLVLVRVLETARELTGASYAALGVLDDRRRGLSQFHTSGDTPEMHSAIGHLPHGRGVLGVLIDEPQPLRLHDVSGHPRSYGFPPGHPPMGNFLGAPIVIRGEAWGNLYLTEKAGADDFSDEDVEAIVVLAEWAAIAIDNARLFRSSDERRKELEHAVQATEAARDIALAVGGETELPPILELIVKRARALVAADALLIWLVDGDELHLASWAGNVSPPAGAVIPVAGSTAGQTLEAGQPLRLDDPQGSLSINPGTFGIEAAHSALLVPLMFRGRGLGVLAAFDHIGAGVAFSAEDERALRSFAASAATAVATARTVERQRLRDTLAAAEAERRRWARDLHDGTLQGLGALKLQLSRIRRAAPEDKEALIDATITQLQYEIAALRGVISDLRPAALDELGLQAALRTLAEQVSDTYGLQCTLEMDLGDRRLEPELETLAYRIVQEALANVAKHAQAEHVSIALTPGAGCLMLQVRDDGLGIADTAMERSTGFGLTGMRERAELAGGSLDVRPLEPRGTQVRVVIPLA